MHEATGGAERVIADVSSGLAEKGHEVSLLSFDTPGSLAFYPLSSRVRCLGLGLGNPLEKATVQETCVRIPALRRIVKEEKPDIVVPFMHSMFILMAFALIGTGIPMVASEHIVPRYYKTRPLEFLFLMASAFMIKRITVLSDSVKVLYPKFLQRRMVAMPNPVHAPEGSADPAGDSQKRKVILNVGRLDPQKDQKTLISAFATVAPHHPEWDIRILGDGPLREDLENLIKQNGLQNRVFLPGTTREIAKEYQQAQIFALPSLYESFGLATAEAMSFGLPTIGFADCPGTNELIVNEENGILVDSSDRVDGFARGMDKLMSSPELRTKYGAKARRIVNHFHPDKIIRAWENLFEEVTQKIKNGLGSREEKGPPDKTLSWSQIPSKGKIIQFLGKLFVSVAILALISARMDWKALQGLASQIHLSSWLYALAFIFIQIFLLTGRWQWLVNLRDHKLNYMASLSIVMASLIANILFITSISGVVVKVALTAQRGFSLMRSICAAVIDRVMTLMALIILAAAFLPFSRQYIGKEMFHSLGVAIGITALLILVFAVCFIKGFFDNLIQSNKKYSGPAKYLYRLLSDRKLLLIIVTISLVAQLSYFAAVYCIAVSSASKISILGLLGVIPAIALVASLPISIGGWGVREGAFIYGLGFIGIPMEAAFLISVQIGVIGIISTVLGGFLALFIGEARALVSTAILRRKP